MKVLSTNTFVSHPAYGKLIMMYNEQLKRDGKVNNKLFFEQVVAPEIPNWSMSSWYKFLKRFQTEAGIVQIVAHPSAPIIDSTPESADLAKTMQTNAAATAALIANLLNISADAAKNIMEHPELLSAKERVELGIKIMKAQDSRIHAIGKVREDNREQERFDNAFSDAAYEQ